MLSESDGSLNIVLLLLLLGTHTTYTNQREDPRKRQRTWELNTKSFPSRFSGYYPSPNARARDDRGFLRHEQEEVPGDYGTALSQHGFVSYSVVGVGS